MSQYTEATASDPSGVSLLQPITCTKNEPPVRDCQAPHRPGVAYLMEETGDLSEVCGPTLLWAERERGRRAIRVRPCWRTRCQALPPGPVTYTWAPRQSTPPCPPTVLPACVGPGRDRLVVHQSASRDPADHLLPGIYRNAALLKRWLDRAQTLGPSSPKRCEERHAWLTLHTCRSRGADQDRPIPTHPFASRMFSVDLCGSTSTWQGIATQALLEAVV